MEINEATASRENANIGILLKVSEGSQLNCPPQSRVQSKHRLNFYTQKHDLQKQEQKL